MTKTVTGTVLAFLMLAGLASAARAQSAEPFVGNRPGATLLLPYFEVDLANANGMTTLFSINNSSATAILSHVTIWSDLGVPVFGFNVYLTGYDVQSINLRDILTGKVPATASAGQDPGDTSSPFTGISNKGPLSQDINFASCSGQLPPPAVPASLIAHMQSSLTGGPSAVYANRCSGRNLGTPTIARGYVTVDTVNNCTLRFPGEPGYFGAGGTGDATNQNVMWGEYQYVDLSKDFAAGDALVSLRASATDPETSLPGEYTFYGRHVGFTAADNREPLSTTFVTRFVGAKEYKQENRALLQQILPPATELLVWRDSKSTTVPFSCGTGPSWYPLPQGQVAAFDEQENAEDLGATPVFGAATQRVSVTTSLPATAESGWLYLNLNAAPAGQVPGLAAPDAAQAWVTVLHRVYQGPTGGRYDVGFRAIRLDSARTPSNRVIF